MYSDYVHFLHYCYCDLFWVLILYNFISTHLKKTVSRLPMIPLLSLFRSFIFLVDSVAQFSNSTWNISQLKAIYPQFVLFFLKNCTDKGNHKRLLELLSWLQMNSIFSKIIQDELLLPPTFGQLVQIYQPTGQSLFFC